MFRNSLQINSAWALPIDEVEWTAVRGSGPGGQNVNKVNSKVEIRWNLHKSRSMPERYRKIILERAGKRLTGAGDILVVAGRFRDQPRNYEDGLERLVAILRSAISVPKNRRATKPTRSSQERRHVAKRIQGEKKGERKHARSVKHGHSDE